LGWTRLGSLIVVVWLAVISLNLPLAEYFDIAVRDLVMINSKYGTSDIAWLRKRIDPTATRYEGTPKLKYLLSLDDDIAERIKWLSKGLSSNVRHK